RPRLGAYTSGALLRSPVLRYRTEERMPTRRLMAVVFVVFTPAVSPTADWPQWRGPNRDGVSLETGLLKTWPPQGPPLAWKINLNGVGYSGPAVVGERIYIATVVDDGKWMKESAVCLDTGDGKEIWRVLLPVTEIGYSTDWGSGPRGTIAVHGASLYALGPRGDLVCL